jgi:cyanophycinase-like exopeptidase
LGLGTGKVDEGQSNQERTRPNFLESCGSPKLESRTKTPTPLSDKEIEQQYGKPGAQLFGLKHVTALHTRDRVRANSPGFAEPLRHASGVWIDGGRQWRLADAYLGTAVLVEITKLKV